MRRPERRYGGEAVNRLDALKAALEAKREAVRELRGPLPISDIAYFKREEEVFARQGEYERLLTDDTIAALIAVAEAADEHLLSHHHGRGTANSNLAAALAPLLEEVDDDRA